MSDTPQNIECFNAACGEVLVTLYKEFPRPVMLNSQRLMDKLPEHCAKLWPTNVRNDNYVAATIRFLHDEGYLRITGEVRPTSVDFPNVVLTSRGFAVLNLPLESLAEPGVTVGQRLMQNLSVEDISTVVTGLIQTGVTLFGR